MTDSESAFYSELGTKLSQGDIVKDVPWGMIPDPVAVCRPDDAKKSEGGGFYAPWDRVKRGGAAFAGGRQERIHADAYIGLGLALWWDCEIDRFAEKKQPEEKWFAAIVPVLPASRFQPDVFAGVKAGERARFFYLPPLEAKGLGESYADLRFVWPIKQSLLKSRVVTLADAARNALYGQLFRFLTGKRWREKVLCPSCLDTIDSSALFDVAPGEEE